MCADYRLIQITDAESWNQLVNDEGGHPLQLWGWGEAKSADGVWRAERFKVTSEHSDIGGAQVLFRKVPFPFREIAYVPRGPFGSDPGLVAGLIADELRKHSKAVSITFEPHTESSFEVERGRPNASPVLLPKTLILDLHQSPEELLSGASKKTRQYIRKSERSGVTVRRATTPDDIAACMQIYHDTADRAEFALHSDKYYQGVFQELGDASPVYIAEVDGNPVAFLWLATSRDIAFELYGGMNHLGQQLRANYILKWTAILDQQSRGVTQYDMNGLLNDGVSKFKRGFAKHENLLHPGADVALSPLYFAWSRALPAARELRRRILERKHSHSSQPDAE